MQKFSPSIVAILGLAILASATITSSAQTFPDKAVSFNTLITFDGTNGGNPVWHLVQGVDGNFYGSTEYAGANYPGTVFHISPEGVLTALDSLGDSHLSVLATDGNFYGTSGGIFKMDSTGILTTLTVPDGATIGGVIQGSDGNFYGATASGGASNYPTVFRVTPAGDLTTIVSSPSVRSGVSLVEGTDGNFYGTTASGGPKGYGTIFRVTPSGWLTTLHTFSGPDGKSPYAALILGSDGNFYGTTYTRGANDPALCEGLGCGTIFKITPRGVLTTLYNFCARRDCADGRWPSGDLVEGTDGNFYGTTQAGGTFGYGIAFKITPQGRFTTLHSFSLEGGALPYAGLTQGTNGVFYGTTMGGGDPNCSCGTVFSLSTGLAPFVKMLPTTGKTGTTVTILGNNLLGSTSVTFNGASASFQAVSDTEIQATVPTEATTGAVEVTTNQGALKSSIPFRVAR
jgi:uncharacterized repeat protein (TIGR03803 family)